MESFRGSEKNCSNIFSPFCVKTQIQKITTLFDRIIITKIITITATTTVPTKFYICIGIYVRIIVYSEAFWWSSWLPLLPLLYTVDSVYESFFCFSLFFLNNGWLFYFFMLPLREKMHAYIRSHTHKCARELSVKRRSSSLLLLVWLIRVSYNGNNNNNRSFGL